MPVRTHLLKTTGASVEIGTAAPPSAGQALVATSETEAAWSNPGAITTTADALTDNSTGTASTTIAAGVGVYDLVIPATLDAGTGAADYATGIVVGHKFKFLSWEFITDVPGVGAGGSRVFNLEIGTTDVGTTPSTLTLTEASTSAKGERTAGTTITGANTGSASAAISIEVAGSGTAFTAGSGYFVIKIQNMDTADAIASILAEYNELLADIST